MNDTVRGLREGSQFGRYRLRRLLGDGGMGQVYAAEDTDRQRLVALKVLPPVFSYDLVFRARLQRLAHVVDRLDEPHIVPIHDYGEINEQQFLDMRLIEGTDLSHLLKQLGTLPAPRAVAMLYQIASALDAAHAIGVAHGDVKPANVLITLADYAYIVDLGITDAAPPKGVVRVIGSATKTWKYTAPERFTASSADDKLDIYALTCVLHECLTGLPPYRADSVGALISAHQMQPIPQPSRSQSAIPAAFDEVITRGMAKDPSQRYSSAGELARAAYEALRAPDKQRAADILKSSQQSCGTDAELELPLAAHALSALSAPTAHQSAQRPHPQPNVSQSLPNPSSPARSIQTAGTLPRPSLDDTDWPNEIDLPATGSDPRPTPPRIQTRRLALRAAAVITLIIVSSAAIWLRHPSQHAPTTAGINTAPSSASSPIPPPAEASARLLSLLPRGYAPGICKPITPPTNALAQLSCDKNSDADGPLSATYMLFPDTPSLRSTFTRIIQAFLVIECPGRIQSPGPWHRDTTPNIVSGVLLCGTRQGNPSVGWTDDAELLIGVITAQSPQTGIDQLYTWWMSHS